MAASICKIPKPLIVILGSTAVGKSKLAIELARSINGEIISADSMQVYKGLDIITNKVTPEEQAMVTHHMINIVNPPCEFTVVQFQKKALEIINKLHENGKIPLIVGGTNYYIESLLWEFLVDHQVQLSKGTETDKEPQNLSSISQTKESLYERLQTVDPLRAASLHPNEIRKISRSLEIFDKTGKKHSEFLKEQKISPDSSGLGGPLRFPNSLVFWITCEQEVLNERISKRVDSMLTNGFQKEIYDFYSSYKSEKHKQINHENIHPELYTEGLFQAIGFKEFHDYFTYDGNDEDKKEKLLFAGCKTLKRVTIKYSKKQKTWIRNRFLARPIACSPDIFELDSSALENWDEHVSRKALTIAKSYLSGKESTFEPIKRTEANNIDPHQRYTCELCNNKIIMGDNAWKQHLSSRQHRRKKRKREDVEN